MRILLIHKFHFRFGGAEKIYLETAKMLRDAGHEVAFFSMHHQKNEPTEWESYFVDEVDFSDEGKSLQQKIRTAFRILWNKQANENLTKLIRSFHPDVAHCFNVYHQLSPSILLTLKKNSVPIVLTLCDFKAISPNYFLFNFRTAKIWNHASGIRTLLDRAVKDSFPKSLVCTMEKWLHEILGSYQAVDVFLSPSDFLIKKYHELGFKRAIRRIHHPLLSEPTQQGGSHLPWSDRPPISLFFGRLSPEKGVDTILRALPLVPERKLEIVGFGPSQSELEKLVTDLHLENRVTFIGPEYGEALAKRMARAKEIIVPAAWYENQPFVLMDSLRSGTPVLASAIGGIPDIIRDGENGFLFAPGDPNDLAKKIRSLSEFDIEKITQEAYRTASDYTPERYVQEILTAYKDAREQRKIS